MKKLLRWVLRPFLRLLPAPLAEHLHTLKHRRHWLRQDAALHATYMAQYRSRSELAELLQRWIDAKPDAIDRLRILELGCSAANNLKLLGEALPMPLDYIGFDLQPQAIEMGRRAFPQATLHVGDDLAMLQAAPALGPCDVLLASGVLAYLPEARCQDVLALAARQCRVLLVCDDLSRFSVDNGVNDGLFLHPYARLCRETGLQVLYGPTKARDGSRYSCFLAVPATAALPR